MQINEGMSYYDLLRNRRVTRFMVIDFDVIRRNRRGREDMVT